MKIRKYRTFSDQEIPRLLDIDTGGGESTDSCWRRENENEAKYAHQMNSA